MIIRRLMVGNKMSMSPSLDDQIFSPRSNLASFLPHISGGRKLLEEIHVLSEYCDADFRFDLNVLCRKGRWVGKRSSLSPNSDILKMYTIVV